MKVSRIFFVLFLSATSVAWSMEHEYGAMGIDGLNKQLDQEIGKVCAKWGFTKVSMNYAVNRQLSAMAQTNKKDIIGPMLFKLKHINTRYDLIEIKRLKEECGLQGPAKLCHFIEALNIDASVDEQKDAYLNRLQRSAPALAERGTTVLVPDLQSLAYAFEYGQSFGPIDRYAENNKLSLNDAMAFVERAQFKLSSDWKIPVSNQEMALLVADAVKYGRTLQEQLVEFKQKFDWWHREELESIHRAGGSTYRVGSADPSTTHNALADGQDVTDLSRGSSSPFKKFIESARTYKWHVIGVATVVVIGALAAVGGYFYFGKKKKEEAPHHA